MLQHLSCPDKGCTASGDRDCSCNPVTGQSSRNTSGPTSDTLYTTAPARAGLLPGAHKSTLCAHAHTPHIGPPPWGRGGLYRVVGGLAPCTAAGRTTSSITSNARSSYQPPAVGHDRPCRRVRGRAPAGGRRGAPRPAPPPARAARTATAGAARPRAARPPAPRPPGPAPTGSRPARPARRPAASAAAAAPR